MNALLGIIGYVINVFINFYFVDVRLALIIETPKLAYSLAILFGWHFLWKYVKKLRKRKEEFLNGGY